MRGGRGYLGLLQEMFVDRLCRPDLSPFQRRLARPSRGSNQIDIDRTEPLATRLLSVMSLLGSSCPSCQHLTPRSANQCSNQSQDAADHNLGHEAQSRALRGTVRQLI